MTFLFEKFSNTLKLKTIMVAKIIGNGIYGAIKAIGDSIYNVMTATANKLDDTQIVMAENLANMLDGSTNCVIKLTASSDC
ncbi:hypothetical protein IB642_01605 [Allofrancisella guangzhouensis]|uniref:Uncharacterized protein n=1 Tax=Allofrancisella guangzhouensis TaxID=594679 RepID=A0A0A8E5C2_9GAMM|nr:hypothetical protein [Allofrancisella guangzhouensis]AJC49193.1 hypothetical protein SD28_05880 [Allofrancisella guangzhouensis]MBK2027330.1 hypothetical protein [Allofrancisella guangzhouensis]MBK2043712.1 hypothetical protein [Allofrancisella guangzhouensis]MBK2045304.1 hypothetical protein [Allofrancisella guangzhouensis]